ncbi:MAG: hypothetical protein FJ316_05560 [SAR202 cluster bacterium]|nr:hypothetical protein [SAR202 cluster bacterium]
MKLSNLARLLTLLLLAVAATTSSAIAAQMPPADTLSRQASANILGKPIDALMPEDLAAATATTITANHLITGRSLTTQGVTDSVTIGARNLALLWVSQDNGRSGTPVLSDPKRTWTEVSSTTPGDRRFTLFRSLAMAPTTGPITIATGDPGGMVWSLVEYSNVDTGGINGTRAITQSKSNNWLEEGTGMSTSGNVLLNQSSLPNSAVAAGFAISRNGLPWTGPGAGYNFTPMPEPDIRFAPCGTICVQAEFKNNFSALADMRWTNNSHWLVIAAELRPAATTPQASITPTLLDNNAAPGTTMDTAQVTITGKSLALLWVAQTDGSAGPPEVQGPVGRAWAPIGATMPGNIRLTLFRSMEHINRTGKVTITSPKATVLLWSLVEYSNVNASGLNGAGAVAQAALNDSSQAGGPATAGSVALTPHANTGSATVGGFVMSQTALPLSAETGYTLTGEAACNTLCLQPEFRQDFDPSVTMSWSKRSPWAGAAVELRPAR